MAQECFTWQSVGQAMASAVKMTINHSVASPLMRVITEQQGDARACDVPASVVIDNKVVPNARKGSWTFLKQALRDYDPAKSKYGTNAEQHLAHWLANRGKKGTTKTDSERVDVLPNAASSTGVLQLQQIDCNMLEHMVNAAAAAGAQRALQHQQQLALENGATPIGAGVAGRREVEEMAVQAFLEDPGNEDELLERSSVLLMQILRI